MSPSSPSLRPAWLALLVLPPVRAAISSLQMSPPRQCEPIVFAWTSSPASSSTALSDSYQLVIVPVDETSQSLRNYSFTSTNNRYVLSELVLPQGVKFVALVQDSDGPDHGRVSQVVQVGLPVPGGNRCSREEVNVDDYFWSDPQPLSTPCGADFGWGPNATDPIGVTGLIPGGQSFNVPVTDPMGHKTTSPWRMAPGSSVLFAVSDGAGDGRTGTLGFSRLYNISANATNCPRGGPLYIQPSSTSMVFATLTESVIRSSSASATASSVPSKGEGHTVSIVAGVLASMVMVAAAVGLVWFCMRRRTRKRAQNQNSYDQLLLADPEPSVSHRPTLVYFDASVPSPASSTGTFPPGPNRPDSSPRPDRRRLGTSEVSHVSHGRESEVSEVERELKRTSLGPREGSSTSQWSDREASETMELLGPSDERLGEEDSRRFSRTRFVRHEDAEVAAGESSAGQELVVDLPPLYQDASPRERAFSSTPSQDPSSTPSAASKLAAAVQQPLAPSPSRSPPPS